MSEFHFDENINVVEIDQRVVYDKVSRIKAKNEKEDFDLELDVHNELYPMLPGQNYRMLISDSLTFNDPEGNQKSLADKFEYVMHGLLYKMAEDKSGKVLVYISFGGLQFRLRADPVKIFKFRVDQKLFLLLRKV